MKRLFNALIIVLILNGIGLFGATAFAEETAVEPATVEPVTTEPAVDAAFSPDDVVFYEAEIKPILQDKCAKCHGNGKDKGGLSLATRNGLLKGGDLGPIVDFANVDDSQLMRALRYEDLEMPPSGKLTDEQIALFARWIHTGLPWTPGQINPMVADDTEPYISDADREYWAYQPITRPNLPSVANAGWLTNGIDPFILAKLEQAGLSPAPPAERRTLIRRLTFDLLGLPPTEEQVADFEADDRPDAYERLVDRMLSSPHYGEKWGRHWLDLVRYAETNGYERDGSKDNVWRYRDYVINAFNNDKPYDVFVAEQIAGDELDNVGPEQLIATGFQRLGLWDDEPADPVQAYYDSLDDVVSTSSQAFLGMTIGCARCHDHKIDPIPQRDYYRMMAFFNNTFKDIREDIYEKKSFMYLTQTVIATETEKQVHREQQQRHNGELDEIRQVVATFEDQIVATFSNPEKEDATDDATRRKMIGDKASGVLNEYQLKAYREQKKKLRQQTRLRLPELAKALTIRENGGEAPPMYVHVRGNAHTKGEEVQPGFPQILTDDEPQIDSRSGKPTSGRRRILAEWLTSADNPLTARVMANRLWQHHFGRGIVPTSNDFGKFGQPPTHPQLLDWLAAELVESGWQVKALHRLILTSSAYRMSYFESDAGLAADPENNLFWRFDMRRLTAEEVRDSVLLLTGRFNDQMGGTSVYTDVPEEILQSASRPEDAWGTSSASDQVRRSVYVHIKRSLVEPVLQTFDVADTDASCPVRFVTTVSTQALTSLNGDFFNKQATLLAERIRSEVGDASIAQIAYGLQSALHRKPTASEIERGVELMEQWQTTDGIATDKALDYFCLMVLNLNELIYLD